MVNVQCFTKKGLYHKKKGEELFDIYDLIRKQIDDGDIWT